MEANGNVFKLATSNNAGARSLYKNLAPATGDQVVLGFDWNVGAPANGTGQLRVQDIAHNNYISFAVPKGGTGTLIYDTTPVIPFNTDISAADSTSGTMSGVPIDLVGFSAANSVYHVEVALNMTGRTVSFTFTNKADPSQTATVQDIPFVGGAYSDDLGTLEFYATREAQKAMSWTSWIDNFNLYDADIHPAIDVPEVPADLTATAVSGESVVKLTWNDVENAEGYNVYRSDVADGEFVKLNAEALTDNSFTDSGLAAPTTYYYKVSSVNQAGESALSMTAQATTKMGC